MADATYTQLYTYSSNSKVGTNPGQLNLNTEIAAVYTALNNHTHASLYSALTESSLGVRNESGSTITAPALVYISGYNATEDKYLVTLADADDPAKPAAWVITANIANNANGTAYLAANYSGADTSARTVGDTVYLSATAGTWTASAPTGAAQSVQPVGTVRTVHASTGTIRFDPGLRFIQKIGTSHIQALAITNALIAAGTIDLTAKVTGILPTANGGTGIAFFTAAGPTAARIYTFPDAACTILTTNALVTAAQGGTGIAYFTVAGPTAARTYTFPDADTTVVGTTASQTLSGKTLTSPVIDTGVSGTAILDEDNMASDSATKLATQQSIKAYVDAAVAAPGETLTRHEIDIRRAMRV